MNALFETRPNPKMKPDGHIERRGRPRLKDEYGRELCPMCRQPENRDEEIRAAKEEGAQEEAERIAKVISRRQ